MINHHFNINYDIVPSQGISAQAQYHNVATLTDLWSVSGHTGFTAHVQMLFTNNIIMPMASAYVRYVGGSGVANGAVTSIQFIALHYNAQNVGVWENLGGLITQRPQYSIDNLAVDVTAQIAGWSGTFYRQIACKVKGTGWLHQARLEIVYRIPDYADDIASLNARVAALEAGGGSSNTPGPLTDTQLQQIADNMRGRLVL